MRKLSRTFRIILILILIFSISTGSVHAGIWEFGTSGGGQNPFAPRGYMIETDEGRFWLSSQYNNSGGSAIYSGAWNGLDYIDAGTYKLYAMSDRNPGSSPGYIGYGGKYLFAYKNGGYISGFNGYVGSPHRGSYGWEIPIDGFAFEPGCRYQFGFLRGMQAHNGITLVLADDDKGNTIGYITQIPSLTSQEIAKYNSEKDREYEFISSWHKKEEGEGFSVNRVPMRFTVQTYADISAWKPTADEVKAFLDSVTDKDLSTGKYKRSNIALLTQMLEEYNARVESDVKYMLQGEANAELESMKTEILDMLNRTKTEKPEPADMKKFYETLKEAKDLYARSSANIGIDIGQYGAVEVELLKEEIAVAEGLDKFYEQYEIDNEVRRLEDAMKAVRASKIMEAQMVFYDKVTGIYVVAPIGSLPEDATLVVRTMGAETEDYKSAKQQLSESETEAIFYRMQFFKGDEKIQPTEEVRVEMPVPQDISAAASSIYSVSEDGKLTRINSATAEGHQFFKTKVVSAFVLAGSTATEEEKAAARGERVKEMMNQIPEENQENKQTELEKEKQKKEEFKDPLNKILKRNANTATFSNDVRRKTNPKILIMVAVVLAAASLIPGIRGIREMRRKQK